MLAVHILNVGHGDSIVLEQRTEAGTAFAVIDSNAKINEVPKALLTLQKLGAEKLSFIAITHPHADHFLGMKSIMQAYAGNIEYLYTFPIERSSAYLQKLARIFSDAAKMAAESPKVNYIASEFIHVLKCAKDIPNWESPASLISPIVVPGFVGVEAFAILPPAKVKGDFYEQIKDGKLKPESKKFNDLSSAYLIKYKGQSIILGGDGTYSNWIFQNRRWKDINNSFSPIGVKLPHHGSKKDSGKLVLDILYGEGPKPDSFALISADGKSHPHNDVLDNIISREIKPYCTGLNKRCGGSLRKLIDAPTLDAELVRFVNSVVTEASNENIQPCQGDIVLRISETGEVTVDTEYNHPCPFRGDYKFLSTGIH